jgi:hypothetical protein
VTGIHGTGSHICLIDSSLYLAPVISFDLKIYSTWQAFAAIKTDGSITAWGSKLNHTVIEPSALRAAKAESVE